MAKTAQEMCRDEQDDRKFKERLEPISIPDDYLCPITHEIMEDPVITWDGHSYERRSITEWYGRGKRNSPLTGVFSDDISLIPNQRLKTIIQDFVKALPKLQRENQIQVDLEKAIQLREEFINEGLKKQIKKLNLKESETKKSKEIEQSKIPQGTAEPMNLNARLKQYADLEFTLGEAFEQGQGVTRDYGKAQEHYENAATLGHADAMCNLGLMYDFGRIKYIGKNSTTAVDWYNKAAGLKHPRAQFYLGKSYADGEGVLKDEAKAIELYIRAANQGYAPAQCCLGIMYDRGRGTNINPVKACEWYEKAAEKGFSIAQFNLGLAYAKGEGVKQDDEKAFCWYEKATAQGHVNAKSELEELLKKIANEDRKVVHEEKSSSFRR